MWRYDKDLARKLRGRVPDEMSEKVARNKVPDVSRRVPRGFKPFDAQGISPGRDKRR
jgi:hypothetical protein